jgi:CarD family transcriptional regulator
LFKVGDRVVHPLHGACLIDDIVRKSADGENRAYYILRFPSGDMSLMLPTDKCEEVGVRPIISRTSAQKILNSFPGLAVTAGDQNWNKRYRDNMLRIRSGDPMEVASVVKSLMTRDARRGLSTGERRMLHFAKDILVSEMTLSMDMPENEIENQLTLAVG